MLTIERILDGLHISVTRRWWTQLFTAFVRVLIGLAFISPGITKILHKPFTVLPDSNPVGAYFNALYNTGYYYEFIGWSQLIAAILLLIPRTSHIGAMLFFPIIVNIAVLTNAVGFAGTWLITILMAIAGLYLVCWEYDRIKPFIFRNRSDRSVGFTYQWLLIPLFFASGGFAMNLLLLAFRIGNLNDYFKAGVILSAIGLIFGLIVAIHYKMMSVGRLDSEADQIL